MRLLRSAFLAAAGLALAAGDAPAGMPLRGGGIEATLDLGGFTQKAGLKNFNANYSSLGLFETTPEAAKQLGHPLLVSVLVDAAPQAIQGNAFLLGFGGMENAKAAFAGPDALPGATISLQRVESPKGALLWYSQLASKAPELYQLQIYFETLQAGKWVELHFSVPTPAPLADPAPFLAKARAIAASLKAQPAPASSQTK